MKKLISEYVKRSHQEKYVFVLVRHSGCTFCREALSELSNNLGLIKKKNLVPVVVHMGSKESSLKMKKDYDLDSVKFIEDPKKVFYKFFGARRGNLKEILGPKVLKQGIFGGSLLKHGIGKVEGDTLQLGGVFMLNQGESELLHEPCNAADVENWDKVLSKVS